MVHAKENRAEVKTSVTKESSCPDCGKKLNGATDFEKDNVPKPGDIGICIHCQGIHIFSATMTRRLPTEEEIAELPLLEISRLQNRLTQAKVESK